MSRPAATLDYAAPPVAPRPGLFPALAYRNYRLWFCGAIVSVIGTWMTGTSLAWVVWERTGQARWLGVLGVCFQAPMAIWLLPAGVLVDRANQRLMLMITQGLLMCASASLAVLSGLDLLTLPAILGIAVLRGSIQGFDMPVRQAFVLEMVDRETLPSAVAMNSAVFNTGRVFGPALAGMLLAWQGPTFCFAVDAASFLAVLTVLPLMRLRRVVRRRPRSHPLHELKLGLLVALGKPRTRTNLAMLAVMSACVMSYGTLLPVLADGIFRGGPQALGYLSAAAGAGALLGALTVSAFCRKARQGLWMLVGALLASGGLLLLGLAPHLAVAMACLVVVGFALLTFGSPSNAAMQLAVGDRYRGRVMSLHGLVFVGAMPLGALFYGYLADHAGVQWAVLVGAAIAMATALTFGVRMARLDRPVPLGRPA